MLPTFLAEEKYSPLFEQWIAKQFQQASPQDFANLYKYFLSRGGPGLVLAEAEAKARETRRFPQPQPTF